MGSNLFNPKLNKKRVLSHADCTVYSVNGLAVRNVAQPDEESGNFATQDEFPDLIPKGEIWISGKLASQEGVFFIANALTRCKRQGEGATDSLDAWDPESGTLNFLLETSKGSRNKLKYNPEQGLFELRGLTALLGAEIHGILCSDR